MPALADATGFVSIGAGLASYTDNLADETSDGSAVEAAASGVYAFSPEVSVQGDLLLHRYGVTYGDVDTTTTQFDGALHLFFRNDSFLIGGFAQAGRTKLHYGDYFDTEQNRAYAGLEGQFYIDEVTLYGRVAAGQSEIVDSPYGDATSWLADLELRYFVTDNFRIDVHAGAETVSPKEYGSDVTNLKFGLGTEYRLDNSPLSLFGTFDFVSSKDDDYLDQSSLRVLVGVKFNFGDETLKSRDRAGATLRPVEATPIFQVKG